MPNPPDAHTRTKLQDPVDHMVLHIQAAIEALNQLQSKDPPSPLEPNYRFLAQKRLVDERVAYANARSHLDAAKEFLRAAIQSWPEGKSIVSDIEAALDEFANMFANFQQLNQIVSAQDLTNKKWLSKIADLNASNKRLGASLDSHFLNGFARLNRTANFNITFDEDGIRSA